MSGQIGFRCLGALCVAVVVTRGLIAQSPAAAFEPQPAAAGTLRIWGDTYMSSVVAAWEELFQRSHPNVHFVTQLMGTDTGMSGLYTGNADIALLGRESNPTENDGFLHTLQYQPLKLRLMTGSLDVPGMSFAPVLFVSRDNPLNGLTMVQAQKVFGCGQPALGTPARTWGDLGLGGEWSDKPIHVYTFDIESGIGAFFLHALQGENRKMNWPIIREFRDRRRTDGTIYDAGEQTMDALLLDRYGLAVSSLRYSSSGVKALALAGRGGSAYLQATEETLIDGTYPLARMTYVFLNRPHGAPVPPLVKEFLQFVYSDEGRKVVSDSHEFLPLTKDDAARQVSLTH